MTTNYRHPNPRKGKRNVATYPRVVSNEKAPKVISGWKRVGPFFVPDKRKSI